MTQHTLNPIIPCMHDWPCSGVVSLCVYLDLYDLKSNEIPLPIGYLKSRTQIFCCHTVWKKPRDSRIRTQVLWFYISMATWSTTTSLKNGIRAQTCGAMKMAKSSEEGAAANQRRSGLEGHRFKIWYQQGLFTAESPLKSILPLGICLHKSNSCVRCIGWLYIWLRGEKCDMSSKNKRSTRVVAALKN